MLKSVAEIATDIIEQRRAEKFVGVEAFVAFCLQRGLDVSDEDRTRVVAEARDN